MPGVVEGIYAQYYDSVIKLARRPSGVSRPELMRSLAVSRPIADRLIDECHLRRAKTEGRTDFFKPTKATNKVLDSEPNNGGHNDGKDAETMIDQSGTGASAPMPATTPEQQALLSAMVSEDPAPQGKNRVPFEPAPAQDQARIAELDAQIKQIRAAITESTTKAQQAHQTVVVQTAHANALGTKLQRVLEARLAL